jgi:hypothetical protein
LDDWKKKVDKGEVPVEIKSAADVDKIVNSHYYYKMKQEKS